MHDMINLKLSNMPCPVAVLNIYLVHVIVILHLHVCSSDKQQLKLELRQHTWIPWMTSSLFHHGHGRRVASARPRRADLELRLLLEAAQGLFLGRVRHCWGLELLAVPEGASVVRGGCWILCTTVRLQPDSR